MTNKPKTLWKGFNMAEKYTKTLTVNLSNGNTQAFTDGAANAFLKRLDNDTRYVKIMVSDGNFDYYDTGSNACGFCKVASVATSATTVADTPCEDALPAACDDESESSSSSES